MSLTSMLESFPPELQPAIARFAETLRDEFGVRRTDFDDLKGVVRELAEAQKRTELRVEELAEAQKRTELRVEELAEAQKRTELRVEELAEAQKRTELRVEELTRNVQELTQAQKRTDQRVEGLAEEFAKFRRSFDSKIGGLGARWGLQTEEAFRQGMRAILAEVGFTTERFLEMDTDGDVFGDPDQVELDVVIKNGKVLVVEIKSALDKGAVHQFARKVKFYARKTGRQIDRRLIVASYVEPRAQETAQKLGVEVCTDVEDLHAS